MVDISLSQMDEASALIGEEQTLISQLSTTVAITAATISAQASDDSLNDSGDGFIAAGFAVDDRVHVSGFTGDPANNFFSGVIATLAAGKMTIAGAEGAAIVDDAAGETVTISKWVSVRKPLSGIGGSVAFIERVDVSAAATVDIDLPDEFDSFYIEFHLAPGTDNVSLNAALSDDAFATVEAGATDYAYTSVRSAASSTGVTSNNGTTIIQAVNGGQGNAAGEYNAGSIQVMNAKEAGVSTTMLFEIIYFNSTAGAVGQARTAASYRPSSSINGLRLAFSSGTATGFYKVWGRVAA